MTVKKNVAYVTSAVALGIVLMLTTFWRFPSEVVYHDSSDQWFTPLAERAQELKGAPEPVVSFHVDWTPVSLMLMLGLICALGVTVYAKRRII